MKLTILCVTAEDTSSLFLFQQEISLSSFTFSKPSY